jgi:hypothetical protein
MTLPPDASSLVYELGGEPPPGLVELLSAEELRMLGETLDTAKRRQSMALDAAIQDALGHVPFVFRGTVELLLT